MGKGGSSALWEVEADVGTESFGKIRSWGTGVSVAKFNPIVRTLGRRGTRRRDCVVNTHASLEADFRLRLSWTVVLHFYNEKATHLHHMLRTIIAIHAFFFLFDTRIRDAITDNRRWINMHLFTGINHSKRDLNSCNISSSLSLPERTHTTLLFPTSAPARIIRTYIINLDYLYVSVLWLYFS